VPAQINGLAVAFTASGFVLLWSGVKGATVGQTLRSLLKGENPPVVAEAPPTIGVIGTGSSGASGSVPGSASDSQIASDALQYQGHKYSYGGYYHDPAGWDCSSFCNWVLGHDLGLTLPGGVKGYAGTSHGPATGAYLLAWSKNRVSGGAKNAQAGDLCVWQSHMGIALGSGQMISALDPALGTKVTSISGGAPVGEVLTVMTVPGVYPTPTGGNTTAPIGTV
jgi:cell wall-associated NlpC family hydrolase